MKVEEIAGLVNGNVIGDASLEITGTAKIEQAQKSDLSFISNQKYIHTHRYPPQILSPSIFFPESAL